MALGSCEQCHRSFQINPNSRFQPTCPRCAQPLRPMAPAASLPLTADLAQVDAPLDTAAPPTPESRKVLVKYRRRATVTQKPPRRRVLGILVVVTALTGAVWLARWFVQRPYWVVTH